MPALLAAHRRVQPDYKPGSIHLGPLHDVVYEKEVKEAIEAIDDPSDWTHDFSELLLAEQELVVEIVLWLQGIGLANMNPDEMVEWVVLLSLCKLNEDEVD